MGRFIAATGADEIYRGGQERDQAWGIVRAPDETLQDPHFHDRGHFVGVTGEGVEEPALRPGAPYIFSGTPWALHNRTMAMTSSSFRGNATASGNLR